MNLPQSLYNELEQADEVQVFPWHTPDDIAIKVELYTLHGHSYTYNLTFVQVAIMIRLLKQRGYTTSRIDDLGLRLTKYEHIEV